jgi:hypothetical protein
MMQKEVAHMEINQWSDIERRHEITSDGPDVSNDNHQMR